MFVSAATYNPGRRSLKLPVILSEKKRRLAGKDKNMKSSNIGGQAVLEGIMMKHQDEYAVAVRKSDGEIVVEKDVYHSIVGNA